MENVSKLKLIKLDPHHATQRSNDFSTLELNEKIFSFGVKENQLSSLRRISEVIEMIPYITTLESRGYEYGGWFRADEFQNCF